MPWQECNLMDERLKYRATIVMRRIASSELLLNSKSLPHLICSRRWCGRSRSDEAFKHGNSR